MVLIVAMRTFRFGVFAILAASSACSRTNSDVRVWRPSDHDQAPTQGQEAASRTQAPDLSTGVSTSAASQGPEAVWGSLCAGCHGQMGQGDGPMGVTVAARNLSDPAWQASMTDERIAAVISQGKGRMPAFSLKPDVVKGLIGFIRAHVRKKTDG